MNGENFLIKIKSRRQIFALSGAILLFAILAIGALLLPRNRDANATLAGFDAGNIMSDAVMANKNSMSEAQIQTFLNGKNSCDKTVASESSVVVDSPTRAHYKTNSSYVYSIKNGKFVCLAQEKFGADGMPSADGGGDTAAHLIWQAAQDYAINPQVLIVLLEKEQGLISDLWPNSRQYQTATGYGCPDTSVCDTQYYGLTNQLRSAANLFRTVLNGGWSNYPAYQTVYIQYSPDASCGGSNVYIQNYATSALYRYTPYQPNAAALAAGTGTASCGAYGNRNFYNFFTEWFSNTSYTVQGAIAVRYNALGNNQSILGNPTTNEYTPDDKTWWQTFENGAIIGTGSTGYWESTNPLRARWGQLDYQSGKMGFPVSVLTIANDGTVQWQQYQNGYLIWSKDSGAWESKGAIRTYWAQLGYQNGAMGFPVGAEFSSADELQWWQQYQNGYIVGSGKTGYWESKGAIRTYWAQLNYQDGVAGLPTGPEQYDASTNTWSQTYQNGTIVVSGNQAKFVKK